jgi:hypothetical protein
MKSTDLRAKARAIFGPAIAEPMPNQPNGAKALQQRANARPIPTYKVGGAVKKADGGMMKPKLTKSDVKMGDALMLTKKGRQVVEAQKRMDARKEDQMAKKRAMADRLLGVGNMKDGGKTGCYAEGGRMKGSTDAARMKGSTDAARMKGSTDSARMPVDLNEKRKKIRLDEKRVRVPSIEYKKGGMAKAAKPKDGLAVMIAIGKPMKKAAKKMDGGTALDMAASKASRGMKTGGMMKPVKRAVGGAGKTRKGMCK